MEILLNQLIIFLYENHFVIITLLTVFAAILALLVWQQIQLGSRFYFSKQRLMAKLIEKTFKSKHFI